jgi:beta-glucosidase
MHTNNPSTTRLRAVILVMILSLCLMAVSPLASGASKADTQSVAAHGNLGTGTLTEQNLHDLIAQMSVDEEDTFVHGSTDNACSTVNISPWVQGCVGQAGWIRGMPRLGIPPLRLSDGPAGVRLGHVATAMPAPIGLTATFDRSLANTFGATVGRGLRATNQDVWIAPMMDMANLPTAGRNFETTGEDPYLAGEIAAQLTRGAQTEGVIATVKQYADNDFENGRNSTSVMIDERTLHEIELQPFEKAAKAGAGAALCAYNRVNDTYNCGNRSLLKDILKSLWNWDGFVVSDWGATHASQDLINGLDMEQSGSSNLGNRLIGYITNTTGSPAVAMTNDMPAQPAYSSTEWKAALDEAVFRILTQMNKAGLLEGTQYGTQSNGCDPGAGTSCTPYVPPRPDLQAIQPDEFAKAKEIAEKSATLLKNDDQLLPLTCADLTTGKGVALMGPTAISTYTGGGGSSHVIPYDPVQSTYNALIEAATAKCGGGVKISYVPGYDIDGPVVPSSVLTAPDPSTPYTYWTLRAEDAAFANQPGLLRQQITTAAVPSGSQPVLYNGLDAIPDALDTTVDYTGINGLPAGSAWRWTGTFTAPAAGAYSLRIFIADQSSAQLFTEGLTTSERRMNVGAYPSYFPDSMASSYASQTVANRSHDPGFQDAQRSNYSVTFSAGQQVHLDLRVYASTTKPVRVQFRWVPTTNQTDQIAIAVDAAGMVNKVVDFIWDEGTEGSDRGGNAIANGLALTGYQNELAAALLAANPNTIVVLNTGAPVFMPWAGDIKSILEMWYPGQMGGPATAEVLLGNANPGGKLPMTFPDGNAPVGQRFPQDIQPAACADNTANYGTASGALPGNPGQCPMYPGTYTPGFLGTNLHSYKTINYSDTTLGGIQGNGIFQGYRWYDQLGYTPLFPFGHGLSYTSFAYANLSVSVAVEGIDVSFDVTNTGALAGDEVAQVYIGAPSAPPVPVAVKGLAAFERISLLPSETKRVTLHIDPRELSYWSVVKHDWALLLGNRPVYVGSSSRDIRLTGAITIAARQNLYLPLTAK